MKRKYYLIALLTILIAVCSSIFLFGCNEEKAPEIYTIKYTQSYGGYVSGRANQQIKKGESGSEVTAVAEVVGYVFEKWSDGVTEATRKEENVIENKEIKAIFSVGKHTVRYIAEEGGKIEGGIVQTGNYMTVFTVTAVPEEGYKFKCWSDGDKNATRYDSFVLEDRQITAYFELKHIKVNYVAESNGKIEGTAQQSVMYGSETETVTAVPNEGYEFDRWSDGVITATRQEKNITNDKQVYAYFKLKHVQVNYVAESNGKIEGIAEQSVIYGGHTEWVTAVPDEGYKFVGWSDGNKSETRRDYCRTDTQITAYFELKHTQVNYVAESNGKIEGTAQQSVIYGGETEIVTAVPYDGYEFDIWSDGVTTATRQDKNIKSDKQICAYFRLKHIQVNYVAESNGKIEGIAEQSVIYGGQTEWVTAVPDEGYKFVEWSDGNKSETRRDYCKTDTQITAYFKIIKRTFKLNYNMVTTDAVSEVELAYFETDKVTLPVPEKDKFTFCGWYQDKLQVSDENGVIIAENKVFENKLNKLHAKWQAHETFTYKILMIYITDVQAMLPTQQNAKPTGDVVEVNYQITELERQIYHNITLKLEEILEDMLDGLVDFEIDEYFTTQPIGTESITQADDGNVNIWPWNIPEITKEQRKQYQSVLTTLNFNEYNHLFHCSAGEATEKYGTVYYETHITSFLSYGNQIEDLIELNNSYWSDIIGTYIHELCHTIEMRKDFYSFHKAAISNLMIIQGLSEFEAYKLYYLCEIEKDGQKIGIPYDFWANDTGESYFDNL